MATIEQSASGVIVRDEHGRFAPGTMPKNIITTANARAMQEKRQELARRAAARRLAGELAAQDPTVTSPAEAFGFLVAQQAIKVMDAERPHMDDVVQIGQAIGVIPRKFDEKDALPAGSARLTADIPQDVLLALISQLRAARMQEEDTDMVATSTIIESIPVQSDLCVGADRDVMQSGCTDAQPGGQTADAENFRSDGG